MIPSFAPSRSVSTVSAASGVSRLTRPPRTGVARALAALTVMGILLSGIPFTPTHASAEPSAESRPQSSIDWRRGFAQAGERLQQKILQGAIQSALQRSPAHEESADSDTSQAVRAQGPGVAGKNPPAREFMEVVPVQSRERRRRESATPPRESATDLGKRGEEAPESEDGSTEINVKNAELEAVIRIFSKKTKRNYILDEKVKGRVSIFLPGKISADESVRILDSVLALKGFTTVPIGENLWKIVPAKEARQSTIPTLTESREGKPSASMVTRLVQLKYVSADDIKQVVTPLISSDGLVNAYTGTNSLIVIDQEDNIERILRIVESLDVPFSDREMTIIPVTYADATEIAQKLQEILGEPEGKGGQGGESSVDLLRARLRETANAVRQGRSGSTANAGSGGESSATVAARAREPKIIADQRTNSIIVVADEDMTSRIRALISQLDSKVDLSGNRFYVYRCQHAKADELANVLAGLVGGGGSSTSSSSTSTRSSAFDEDNSSSSMRSRSSLSSRTSGGIGAPSLSSQRSNGANRSAATVSLGENISVTADPATNSLIISAGKTDYMKLRALLEKLDVKRRQVLVEALLLEVGIDDTVSMGTEWMVSGGGLDGGVLARNNLGGLDKLLADPVGLSGFSIAAASSGSLTLGNDVVVPAQTVLLSAAKQNQNVNVLSAPNVLATDNEQAEILVGQNVPFLASTSTSETNLNNTFNQVERQDVGITLRLTPQISSNDFVTLNIFTEVSNVILATLNSPLGPTTTKRASETTVITKDGQMVVIGGLMSDDVTTSENGVPFLEDVPVFGSLFRSSTDSRRRTNLLIFITPRIVKDQFDARDITIEDREQMERAIAELDAQPDRREHLRNRAVDEVAETANPENENADVEGVERSRPSHGTITAPATAQSTAISSGPLTGPVTGTTVDVGGTEGVISLSVSPKLFEEPRAPAENASMNPEPRAHYAPRQPEGQFIVLRLDDASGAQISRNEITPPFTASLNDRDLALHLPAGSQAAAYRFFEAGSRYSYRIGERTLSFEAVGVFDTEEDGRALLSSTAPHWYTPSPFEVMAMAQGSSSSPWQRR